MYAKCLSAVLLSATQATADCAPDQDVFSSCEIAGRGTAVSVCFDEKIATYRYGPIGKAPELVLIEPIKTLEFEPWSGVSRETGESVTFYNGDYSYEVVGGFERLLPDENHVDENGEFEARTRSYGWIDVAQNGERLATLTCIPKTVTYGYGGGLYDLKTQLGQTWDAEARHWITTNE